MMSLWQRLFVVLLSLLQGTFARQPESTFSNTIPSVDIVYETALLTRACYDIDSVEDELFAEYLTPKFFKDYESGREVCVATYDEMKILLVIFRGSDEREDWMINLDIAESEFGPKGKAITSAGKVHRGFNRNAFSGGLYDAMVERIRDKWQNGFQIIFAGHSKGGAEALLFGSYFAARNELNKNIMVITFGQPKLGDDQFRSWLKSIENLSVWRFVLEDDPVPRIPPNLDHVGHLVQLDENGAKAYFDHDGDEQWELLGAPDGWDWDINLNFSVHYMRNYVTYFSRSMNNPSAFYVDQFEEIPNDACVGMSRLARAFWCGH